MSWMGKIVAVIAFLLIGGILLSAYGRTEAPVQPITFSHKVHAGDYKIPCQYCHVNARRAAVAGIPSVGRCMGCHKITAAAKPEVQKLKGFWDRKEPISWTKVTWMPDFVFFEHWPHVQDGLACQTCHGPVETMRQMKRNKDLTMSSCVICHRQRKVSIDCVICHR